MGGDCYRRRRRDRDRSSSVQALLPAGMRPSAVATTVLAIPAFYFLMGMECFPGDRMDMLALDCGGSWGRVLHHRAGDGPHLGASGMGHLVGAGGHPPDFHARCCG